LGRSMGGARLGRITLARALFLLPQQHAEI
jgi:hypothetical protein